MRYPLDALDDTIPMAIEMPRQVLPALLGAMRLLLENAAWESNDDRDRFANAIADAERRLAMPSSLEIDASQITSGVLDAARIPPVEVEIDASQITSGVLDGARIPPVEVELDASQITSGVLDGARIPSLSWSYTPYCLYIANRITNNTLNRVKQWYGDTSLQIGQGYAQFDGYVGFGVFPQRVLHTTGKIRHEALPSSTSGLAAGDVYRDANGFLKVKL